MGVSGSGKTTVGKQLAKDLGWHYSDADDFHSLKNISKMGSGIPLTDNDRSGWLNLIKQFITKHIKSEKNLVISCSALKTQYRTMLQIAPEHIQFVYLKGTQALIERRLSSRKDHFMKATLLASQFQILEEPKNTLTIDITLSAEQISTAIQKSFSLLPKGN